MFKKTFARGARGALTPHVLELNAVDASNARSVSEVRARALGGCGGGSARARSF